MTEKCYLITSHFHTQLLANDDKRCEEPPQYLTVVNKTSEDSEHGVYTSLPIVNEFADYRKVPAGEDANQWKEEVKEKTGQAEGDSDREGPADQEPLLDLAVVYIERASEDKEHGVCEESLPPVKESVDYHEGRRKKEREEASVHSQWKENSKVEERKLIDLQIIEEGCAGLSPAEKEQYMEHHQQRKQLEAALRIEKNYMDNTCCNSPMESDNSECE